MQEYVESCKVAIGNLHTVPLGNCIVRYGENSCACGTLEVIVSRRQSVVITSKIRRRMKHAEKVHVMLTKPSKVDIYFTKLVNANVPNFSLCFQFDTDTL